METNHKTQLAGLISEMFLRYPAASKVSAKQISVYVNDLSQYPASAVARAIDAVRADTKRNAAFPPSADEIKRKLGTVGMNVQEQAEYLEMRGMPPRIESAKEVVQEASQLTEQQRADVVERMRPHLEKIGCRFPN